MPLRSDRTQKRSAAVVVATVLVTVVAGLTPALAEASSVGPQVFYVDNRTAACSDTGAGTAPDQPWCDFTPIGARSFGPGQRILLARGARWDQELTLTGSGAPGQPLEIGAYGTGARPRIERDGHNGVGELQRSVLLTNPSYVHVADLSVGRAELGIEAYYTTPGHRDLQFRDIDTSSIHGIHNGNMNTVYPPDPTCNGIDSHTFPGVFVSAGVVITGPPPTFAADQSYLSGVVVDGLTGQHNQATLSTQFCNGVDAPDAQAWPLVRDLSVRALAMHDDDGDGVAPGCADGLHLIDVVHARILDSSMIREGGCPAPAGTTAVIASRSADVVLANSTVADVVDTRSYDQTGIDLEYNLSQVALLNNDIARNAGPGVTFQSFRAGDHLSDVAVQDNVFDRNADADPLLRPTDAGGVLINGAAFGPTGRIADNLYAEPTGFLRGEPPTGFTVTNNRAVDPTTIDRLPSFDPLAPARVRAPGVISTSWRGWTRAGGMWTWTAPQSGRIAIRARAFTTGDYRLAVVHNGQSLWTGAAGAGDWTGVPATIDDLVVRAGDQLTFQAESVGGDPAQHLSWRPVVALLPNS